MKRKLHPHRRHGRRHVSAAERYAYACEGYAISDMTGRPREVDPFPNFPRARRGAHKRLSLRRLVEAGYTFASIERTGDWTQVHAWLQERCTHRYGKTYVWFGGTFVFEQKEDRDAFAKAFPCADGYKPMFAFESGR